MLWRTVCLVFYVHYIFFCDSIRLRRSATECPEGIVEEEAGFRVFVTINALSYVSWNGNLQSRKIELNWTPPSDGIQENDYVQLVRLHSDQRGRRRLLTRIKAKDHDGYFKTDVSFPRNPMMGRRSPTTNCLYGFWIVYIRDARTLKANCIRVRPQWMFEDRHIVGDIPLHALMIPGTHNSGAYDVNFGRSDSLNIMKKFSINQDEDVWSQLLYGIRYLDLRVGYYKTTPEKFWVVHDFVKMNPLYEVVNDIRRFLTSTKELVILDFHRFPNGFDNDDEGIHASLLRYLQAELGQFMAPDWLGRSVTPNDLWEMNRTLIVTYSHDPSSAFSDVLWSEVRHVWGNQQNSAGLKNFLGEAMNLRKYARYPWAAMSHLTPTKWNVFFRPNSGMRELSDSISRNLTQWYRDEWWNAANIIATDFFLGNNLIEESIIANRRRNACRRQARFS